MSSRVPWLRGSLAAMRMMGMRSWVRGAWVWTALPPSMTRGAGAATQTAEPSFRAAWVTYLKLTLLVMTSLGGVLRHQPQCGVHGLDPPNR